MPLSSHACQTFPGARAPAEGTGSALLGAWRGGGRRVCGEAGRQPRNSVIDATLNREGDSLWGGGLRDLPWVLGNRAHVGAYGKALGAQQGRFAPHGVNGVVPRAEPQRSSVHSLSPEQQALPAWGHVSQSVWPRAWGAARGCEGLTARQSSAPDSTGPRWHRGPGAARGRCSRAPPGHRV